ncbi:uncharacterized protein LOC100902751 isoform X2 [Galendromus occidentalis]|uniref:Uncharacterized protein LOC100902751 isoform X2 n=1 Tax=Galendromus occidentalis TaxID=34638 RepID=A0AAJ6VZT0_9ACAR|nr:uncharacterized protein LOC100902751 isoform X2 [Galendromus occidentalis]
MLSRSLLFSVAFAGVVYSQTVIVTNSDVDSELSATGKIIRPNVTITTSQRRVYVPKEPKSSQFFHLVPSTPTPVKPESTSLAPPAPTKMRSVHRISNTTYQMPADFLCEGLDCPKGHQCSLAQPTCTPEDCSLKPSCAKKLSDHCEKCQPPCVHAILNLDAPGGCHPCLCEVTVFRPPPRLAKRLAAIAAQ